MSMNCGSPSVSLDNASQERQSGQNQRKEEAGEGEVPTFRDDLQKAT